MALAAAVVAYAFAANQVFLNWLRVDRTAGPWAAALTGGVATVLFICAAWTWTSRLRWVAVSLDGLRWLRGPRARHNRWKHYVGVHHGYLEISVWGKDVRTGRYADIEFREGRSLRISTCTIPQYDDLIAEIQTTASQAVRIFCPVGGSHSGRAGPEVVAYGPLRLHPDGIEWGGTHFHWDRIVEYEVRAGYLHIQPDKGAEFLRRLTDLGDSKPALARLDENIGSRRVGKVPAAPTDATPRSQRPAVNST